jgi:microcin C transport system permease protein
MIERIFRNDISRKRWKRFRSNRVATAAASLLLVILLLSGTAEIWANRKPLIMKYHGQVYFPVFTYYPPAQFGLEGLSQMDYRSLKIENGDWALWPVIRWDPLERNEKLTELPSPPTRENWMGTDEGGRDVAARLLYGFRYSIAYAAIVWLLTSIVGMIAGAIMGFKGGLTDLLGQRVIEIVESLPYLMILITLVSIFKPTLLLLAVLTVFFNWVTVSIYFRAEFLKLRRREFVEAAHALGASKFRMIFSHILPNSLTPWITYSPFMIAGNISSLAILDFLGFGLPPPTPSWGELLSQALNNFQIAWWLAVFPSLALFLTLTLLNLIGEAVREALDPRAVKE